MEGRYFSIDLAVAIRGVDIDNMAAQNAIDGSKALHARRWQTKDGTYRLDEELFSSPPMGARTHGLPMMTDWSSLSAIIGALTYRSSVQWRAIFFWQWLSPDETCRGMCD